MVHTDSESNPSLAVTRMPVHGLIFLHFLDKNSRRKVVVLPLEEAVSDGVHDCEQGALDGAQCRALTTLRLGFGATVLQAVSNVHQVPKIMARLNTGRMIQYSRNHNHDIYENRIKERKFCIWLRKNRAIIKYIENRQQC